MPKSTTKANGSLPSNTPARFAPKPVVIPTSTPVGKQANGNNGGDYPARAPKLVDLRTQGEQSISTARVTQSVRMRFNPLRGLKPDGLASYLDQFDLGFFRQAAIVWDRLERRDYKLKSVVPKRKKAVARHGFEIITVDCDDSQRSLAEKQAETLEQFYNNLTATDALKPDQQGGLSLLVRQMMDATSKYYAVHEVVWMPGTNGLSAQFVFCPLWWFEGTTGKIRYMDSEFQVYGRDMLPGEWLITCGEGLMEACSVAWMFKHLSLQDWLNYCERYGQPFIDAATSASPDSDEWDKLVDYVTNFAGDGGGVRSQSAAITLIESKTSTSDTYAKMVENMDRAMTIIWRGGDLGTTSAANQTGASLQGDESEILETDDAVQIEETLATQVSRFVISYTFGPDAPVLAYLKFSKQDKKNTTIDLQIDQFLLNAGAPLSIKNTLERYSRPMPEDDEDLLKSIAAISTGAPQIDAEGNPIPTPGDVGAVPGADVQATALNGAQVTALASIAEQVAQGLLPLETAKAIAYAAFPVVPPAIIEKIFKGLKSFKPTSPEPAPAPTPGDFANDNQDIAVTLHEIIFPILKRLEAIAAVEDAAIQQHMLEKLLKDFPGITNAMKADDSLAKKLSPQLETQLQAGLKMHKGGDQA